MLAGIAQTAGVHRERMTAERDQAAQEVEQLIAGLGDQIGPELRGRAASLSAISQRQLYQQLTAHRGQPPEILRAIASALISILGRSAPPEGAVDQISQLMLQLAGA